jgi:putative ABC transport system permease protein
VQPAVGRIFSTEDGMPGKNDVAILSDGYWKRKFGGDRDIIGKSITLGGRKVTIIGVMPPDFRSLMTVDLWQPMAFREEHRNMRGRYLRSIARLKAGVSIAQAQAEMKVIADRTRAELPDFNAGWGAIVVPLRDELTEEPKPALLVLLGAVGFVLLIACGNVANLLLARAAAREREIAVRATLGASRLRLSRQLLTESMMLGLAGGLLGILLAWWALEALLAITPVTVDTFTQIELNLSVLLFGVGLSVLSGVLFGVAPAMAASRGALSESLKEGGRGTAAVARPWLRNTLVVSEVALSLVLLVGAGLLLRSFARLQSVNPGFQAENVLSMQISLGGQKYRESASVVQFYQRAVERIQQTPGVTAVGAISWLPLSGRGSATDFRPGDRPAPKLGEEPVADVRMVTPDLFRAMGIPLLRGRPFGEQDTASAPAVVIVNDAVAKQYWPNEEPIGKRIIMAWGKEINAEIVGVVGDVHLTALDQTPRATLYWPHTQLSNSFMSLMIRSTQDPASLTSAVKSQIAALDPEQPIAKVQRMRDVTAESVRQPRFTTLLLGSFAGLALLLAAVGIYGVIAYSVAQRTHEIGIRMALGATRDNVLRMVLRRAITLTLVGVLCGLAAAAGLSRFLRGLLFEVSTLDSLTFAAVAVCVAAVSLAACWIPARRATRVDPIVALRYE